MKPDNIRVQLNVSVPYWLAAGICCLAEEADVSNSTYACRAIMAYKPIAELIEAHKKK